MKGSFMLFYKLFFIGLVLVMPLFSDHKEGKEIFNEASCLDCHNHEDFGDKKSEVKFFKQLEDRVQACQLSESDELFDDEVHSVAKYLNKEFYKLKK